MIRNGNENKGDSRIGCKRFLGEVLVGAPLYGWDGQVLASGKNFIKVFLMSWNVTITTME